jgi:hypothetical protein
MRYADPFREAGRPETTDHDFLLTCSCGAEQRIDEMVIDESGPVTLYECARCTADTVGVLKNDPDAEQGVAPQGMARWEERAGYEMRGYIIGSRVDIAFRPEDADADLLRIPATPYFFKRYLNL